MRTTLNIEDDVLNAAMKFARKEKKSVGQIISELARTGLAASEYQAACQPGSVYGFRPFPKTGRTVSNELINKLREGGERAASISPGVNRVVSS